MEFGPTKVTTSLQRKRSIDIIIIISVVGRLERKDNFMKIESFSVFLKWVFILVDKIN